MKKRIKIRQKKPKENITNTKQYELLKEKHSKTKNTRKKNNSIKCNSLKNVSATLFMFEKMKNSKNILKLSWQFRNKECFSLLLWCFLLFFQFFKYSFYSLCTFNCRHECFVPLLPKRQNIFTSTHSFLLNHGKQAWEAHLLSTMTLLIRILMANVVEYGFFFLPLFSCIILGASRIWVRIQKYR